MKAIYYTHYGSPAQLQCKEMVQPVPGENEVLVKVIAASINSWDWDLLTGRHFIIRLIGGLFRPRHKILGADIAGIVEKTGSKVNDFKPGDAVFGDIAGSGFGGFAEYVAVPEKLLALKSPQMTFEQAAALPQAGLLALQALNYKGSIHTNQEVLINGAGGGVGTWALQYAKSLGAVVTCVDSPDKFDLLRSLGADYLVDYTREDYTRNSRQYDRVLDVIALRSVSDYKRALKPGGTFAMIGGSMGWLLVQFILLWPVLSLFTNKKMGLMGYKPNRADLDKITNLFETGVALPVIDRVYPLHKTQDAFEYFSQGRFKGKVIIAVSPVQ